MTASAKTPSMANRLLNIPGVTRLTFEDEQLFRIAFQNEGVRYGSSWLYMLRASHDEAGHLGFKFYGPNLIAILGHRRRSIYVTPVADYTNGSRLQSLCQTIFEATGLSVIIKKLPDASYQNIDPAQLKPAAEMYLEDDSSPETILQLPKLFSSGGGLNPTARALARQVRKFERLGIKLTINEDLRAIPIARLIEFLKRESTEKFSSYSQMIRYLIDPRSSKQQYKVMVFSYQHRIEGLYLGEQLSLTELGLYCGLTTKNRPGGTEWMDVVYFKKLLADGILTVHLGGAETLGVKNYVYKLMPHKPRYLAHTVLYDHSASPEAFLGTIRAAREEDITPLAELYCHMYNSLCDLGEHWTFEAAHKFIGHFLRRQPDLFFLAEHNGRVIGAIVAAIQPWWDGNHLVEGELVVDADYKHKGVDKQLLKALISRAHDKYQIVAWDTAMPAISDHPLGSYEKLGFTEIPHWKAITGDAHTILSRLG